MEIPTQWDPAFKKCTHSPWKDEELLRPIEDLNPADRARLWQLIHARQGTSDRLQFRSCANTTIEVHDNNLHTRPVVKDRANALLNDDTELDAAEGIFDIEFDSQLEHFEDRRDHYVNDATDHHDSLESNATIKLSKSADLPLVTEVTEQLETFGSPSSEASHRVVEANFEAIPTVQPAAVQISTESCQRPQDRRKRTGSQSDPSYVCRCCPQPGNVAHLYLGLVRQHST